MIIFICSLFALYLGRIVAPPPKVAAPRRSTSVTNSITSTNNNNNVALTNGNTDLFGSDPFEINNGPSIFKVSVNADDAATISRHFTILRYLFHYVYFIYNILFFHKLHEFRVHYQMI